MAIPTINIGGMEFKVTTLLSNKTLHTSVKDFVNSAFGHKKGLNQQEFQNFLNESLGVTAHIAKTAIENNIGSILGALDKNKNGLIERNEFNGFCKTLGFDVNDSIAKDLTVGDSIVGKKGKYEDWAKNKPSEIEEKYYAACDATAVVATGIHQQLLRVDDAAQRARANGGGRTPVRVVADNYSGVNTHVDRGGFWNWIADFVDALHP